MAEFLKFSDREDEVPRAIFACAVLEKNCGVFIQNEKGMCVGNSFDCIGSQQLIECRPFVEFLLLYRHSNLDIGCRSKHRSILGGRQHRSRMVQHVGRNADIQAGLKIVSKALEAPIRQIAENAGVEGSIVVGKVLEKSGNFGFDAQNEEYGDMIEKGIIDPAKVVRVALQDAASVSSLLITTEAMIAEKPKNAPPAMPGGGGMGGGMGGMDF